MLRALTIFTLVVTADCSKLGRERSLHSESRPDEPCQLTRTGDPTAIVLGGDDAGTGAAWALASLGVKTLLVLTHRRDLGGDPASFYHDGGKMVRNGGGLNDLLLCSTNNTCASGAINSNVANGPGGAFLFFDTLLRTAPLNKSLEIIEGYIALPHSGQVDTALRVEGVSLMHRNGSTCSVRAKYVVDGTPEGYGVAAFNLPVVFGREALHNKSTDDPTTRAEPYAGRRTFSINGHGPPIESWSDRSVETEDVSSGVGPITNLCQWAKRDEDIDLNSPWLLTKPPARYNPADFAPPPPWAHSGKPQRFVEAECCANGQLGDGCDPMVFRYQGLSLSTRYAQHTGSTGPSLPGWYLLEDGKTHYLRRSYSDPIELWNLKRHTEINAFYWAVGGLWYIQNEIPGGQSWGFCNSSFPSVNPALEAHARLIPPGPYTLADFNTSTYGGDQTVAFRLYHRQVARLGAIHPVGAAQLYDGKPRVPSPPDNVTNKVLPPLSPVHDVALGAVEQMGGNTKKYWEPSAVVFPLYGTDFTKGVLGATVTLPPGCTGDCGDGVLMGNGPSDGNMHGMTRNLFTPDAAATHTALSSGDYPPAGMFERSFVENFLSPGTPRSTFMLQSSARIGCFASNIGVAAGTVIGVSERLGLMNTSAVPTMLVQWTLGYNLSTAITYFNPPVRSTLQRGGTVSPATFAALHIAGAYAVPPRLNLGTVDEGDVAKDDLHQWLLLYKEGVLTGRITSTPNLPPEPTPEQHCLTNESWFAYIPDWDVVQGGKALRAKAHPSFNCKAGSILKKCTAKSTTLPPHDVRCFPPGDILQLRVAPHPSLDNGLLIVDPVLAPQAGVDHPIRNEVGSATRAELARALDDILGDSAGCAVALAARSGSAAQLPFTIAQLAHVVTRHAMCLRKMLHDEEIMGALGLQPYSFQGDY